MAKIKPQAYSRDYQDLLEAGIAAGKDRDCAVVSIAAATGVTYTKAREALKEAGRRSKEGTYFVTFRRAMTALGFNMTRVDPEHFISRYPAPHNNLNSVTSYHPRRFPEAWAGEETYVIFSDKHVWTVRNGLTVDWSCNRTIRAVSIYRITKKV